MAAFNALNSWEILPTSHQKKEGKMTTSDIHNFTRARVAVLLRADAFCDDGLDDRGHPAIYNHAAFLEFVVAFFYGHDGIAVKYPDEFSDMFPISALAFARSIIRIVLKEYSTGEHITEKLNRPRQKQYHVDLDMTIVLANPATDAYHAPSFNALRRSIAVMGR